MKFILVNCRTPLDNSTCAECSRSLVSGYLKAVSTRRQYCDYDCYVRDEARNLLTSGLTASYETSLKVMTLFAVASGFYSIAFAKAARLVGDLVTADISGGEGPRAS